MATYQFNVSSLQRGIPETPDISCTSEIPPPSLAKMDSVIVVVHDEFQGIGLSGVGEFLDEGAVGLSEDF